MADELVSALLRAEDLRVVLALTSDLSRRARELASMRPGSAAMLAQGLTAGPLSANVSETPILVGITEQGDGVERRVADEVGRSFKPSS